MPAELVLGIDTGGTFTDAVLYDYVSRQVLASCKRLTTRRDFALGIQAAIDGLALEDPAAIRLVSISTTLATNAIAEGKGRRVGLLLIGYDPELIDSFQLAGRFATPHYFYFRGGHDHFGQEVAPPDLEGLRARMTSLQGQVDALAISSYFSPLNPEHEQRAFEAVTEVSDLPVVLGHQLSTRLNSVERATTAALNASLLGVLKDFITAMGRALSQRGIKAPLMVVRGDGTMVEADFVAGTPVETIHSGPAASAIGGRALSGLDDALVIDVGGTTTDLALLEDGQVAVNPDGASVGGYKTAVEAANLRSIGLGGDSWIHLARDGELKLGPERVIPLAYLGDQFPAVRERLAALAGKAWNPAGIEALEYWTLARQATETPEPRGQQEETLLELLAGGPLPLPEILDRLGLLHVSQLGAEDLFRREVVARCGLTPTDLMHVDGRFSPWDAQAAALALAALSQVRGQEPEQVGRRVWALASELILHAVLSFLTGRELSLASLPNDREMGRWFFFNSLYRRHSHLETLLRLRVPIIGIGAPAGIFLPAVAEVLQTELVLPDHYEVANALGAVAASVMVAEEILVYPRLARAGLEVIGYYVQTDEGRRYFDRSEEALACARSLSEERVLLAARRAGAQAPRVLLEERQDGLETVRVRAKAIGSPRLGRSS